MTTSRYTPSLVVGAPTSPARLSWQEFSVVLVTTGLAVFFNLRGTPIMQSVAYAAGAMLVFVGLVTVPRAIKELVLTQRLLQAAVEAPTWEQRP